MKMRVELIGGRRGSGRVEVWPDDGKRMVALLEPPLEDLVVRVGCCRAFRTQVYISGAECIQGFFICGTEALCWVSVPTNDRPSAANQVIKTAGLALVGDESLGGQFTS